MADEVIDLEALNRTAAERIEQNSIGEIAFAYAEFTKPVSGLVTIIHVSPVHPKAGTPIIHLPREDATVALLVAVQVAYGTGLRDGLEARADG